MGLGIGTLGANGMSRIRVPLPRHPDLRDADFILFVIGDWEIGIVNKIK